MLSKATQTALSKEPPTATVMCKYHPFRAAPPPSPVSKQRKVSSLLLYLKNCGLKFLPKSFEKTLPNKSK